MSLDMSDCLQVVNGVRYVLNVELTACLAEVVPCEVSEEAEGELRCRLELLEGSVDRQRTLLSSLCQPLSQVLVTMHYLQTCRQDYMEKVHANGCRKIILTLCFVLVKIIFC